MPPSGKDHAERTHAHGDHGGREPDAEAPAEDAKEAAPAEEAPKTEKKKVDFGKACGSFYSAVDKFKTAIGILAIALAVLHFCFPAVVLI